MPPAVPKPPLSTNDFLSRIRDIYGLTDTYQPPAPQQPLTQEKKNLLCLQLIRSLDKDSYKLNRINGSVPDYNFINYAASNKTLSITSDTKVQDPLWNGITIKITDLFAKVETIYLRGLPATTPSSSTTTSPPAVNISDLISWGGDWIRLYSTWRRAIDKKGDKIPGDAFCRDNLAVSGTTAATATNQVFTRTVMITDVDAWNIASNLKASPSKPLPDILDAYFNPPGTTTSTTIPTRTTRFKVFSAIRFPQSQTPGPTTSISNPAILISLAMLTSYPQDPLFISERWSILKEGLGATDVVTQPAFVGTDDLIQFCSGFDVALKGLVDEEKRLRGGT